MNKSRITTAVAALVLVAGATLGTAVPAHAVSGCEKGSFCGWWDLNYTGTGPYGSSGDLWFVGWYHNDKFTSVFNNGYSLAIRAYDGWNYSDGSIVVRRGIAFADLRNYGFNDHISSFNWF